MRAWIAFDERSPAEGALIELANCECRALLPIVFTAREVVSEYTHWRVYVPEPSALPAPPGMTLPKGYIWVDIDTVRGPAGYCTLRPNGNLTPPSRDLPCGDLLRIVVALMQRADYDVQAILKGE